MDEVELKTTKEYVKLKVNDDVVVVKKNKVEIPYYIPIINETIIYEWLLTSIFYNFPQNIRSINEAKLPFLWLNLHSVSFKCKINFVSVKPLNFAKRRLA